MTNFENGNTIDGSVLFSETIGINVSVEGMSGSRKVSLDNVEVDADKDRLRLASKILQCSEMSAIKGVFQQVRANLSDPRRGIALPALFKRGAYLIRRNRVAETEAMLREHADTLSGLVANLKAVYAERIAEDKLKLREKFNSKHYPAVEALDDTFKIKWHYQSIAPTLDLKTISEDVYKAEVARVTAEVNLMGLEIVATLRATALDLVKHLTEKLGTDDSGKPKSFKGSSVKNLVSFLTSFEEKNVMGDKELGNVLAKMRALLSNDIDPKELRTDEQLRASVKATLDAALPVLDSLVQTSGRVVTLPDEDETEAAPAAVVDAEPVDAAPVVVAETCKKHKTETKPCQKCKAESVKRAAKKVAA